MNGTGRTVVVGYDGSEHSEHAVLWAADEAGRQDLQLVVLAAEDYGGLGLRGPVFAGRLWAEGARRRASCTAEAGAALVRHVRPDVTVEPVGTVGAPARAIADASAQAALVVVGTRGRSALAEAILGSVAEAVAGRCLCPVVVVRAATTVHAGPSRPVVVGFDGSAGGMLVVAAAATLAADVDARLTVVTACEAASRGAITMGLGSRTEPDPPAGLAARDAVDRAVALVRANHPGLDVDGVVVEGPATEVLIRRSERAGLLVVGSARHDLRRTALLGSVSRGAARTAPCPVAVVSPRSVVPRARSRSSLDTPKSDRV